MDSPKKMFIPVEFGTLFGEAVGGNPSPLDWYVLIRQMERFRALTGWGLARTWSFVMDSEYDEACKDFLRAVRAYDDSSSPEHNKDYDQVTNLHEIMTPEEVMRKLSEWTEELRKKSLKSIERR